MTSCDTKVRVVVLALDDVALPCPLEPERWGYRRATDPEVHGAIAALHMARELGHYEKTIQG